jgi:hypothetical protein
MAGGHLVLASDYTNASTAGMTSTVNERVDGATPWPPPVQVDEILHGDNLPHLFSGGSHPESIPGVVLTPLEKATDSIRGRLGGLVPARGSVLQPGPAGGAATARSIRDRVATIIAGIPGVSSTAAPSGINNAAGGR